MALGSTQPLTEMSTRNISWGKEGRCVRLTTLPPSCAVVTKSGNPNFLEPSGLLQACNGTALPLPFISDFVKSTRYSCQISIKEIFFSIDFQNKDIQISNSMLIRPVGADVIPCWWTDRHDEANCRFSQIFCGARLQNGRSQGTFQKVIFFPKQAVVG